MADPSDLVDDVPSHHPVNIATISAGFEKGDFLVREEQGNRVYFDFFEEAFNYIANKGYARMEKEQEKQWMELMSVIHDSVKGGMKYNTGTLLMVLSKPVGPEVTKDTKEKASKVRAATTVKQEGKNP
mmetsp:Transcript_20431/g.24554  ORF Transcript_20431/g.24554 Transcript_20431/m.24554 type:complete len:128 (-) Transcript_20431:145-528(-)|eukprot:CAMPEP_0195264374 /NCGR_PEP_ID=MMETSP0706-20130129/10822_1 /TAXON_ID=33640 /ORGANISM="Asterionellopsis glacialis, Strain CCMP134" /LENGTH=127 /DNA_ID=CAMNT_0040318653 /DNA_START=123 /DNA_END=506 /DNA_ORIENTATION=+